ncbi:hypothetical protein ACFLZ2_01985 [Candidatus Margulisiibacteriota bacterium]
MMKNLLAILFLFTIILYAGDKILGEYEISEWKDSRAGAIRFVTTDNEEIEFSGTYLIKHKASKSE